MRMAEFSNKINFLKSFRQAEAQREADAIYSVAEDETKDTGHENPTSEHLQHQSEYADHLRKTNPDLLKYIVEEEELRHYLTEDGGAELFNIWKSAWDKISVGMKDEADKAGTELESAIKSAHRKADGRLSDRGEKEMRAKRSQIRGKLIAEAVDRMRNDESIVNGFRGKEKLLEKGMTFLRTYALFKAGVSFIHYLPLSKQKIMLRL